MGKSLNLVTGTLGFAMLIAASLGCSQLAKLKQKPEPSDNRGPAYPTPNATGTPLQTKSGLDEKTQLYITKCFNPYANSVMNSYQRYTSWIKNVDQGPTGKETLVYGLYEVHGDGQDCVKAVSDANVMEPDLPETEAIADEYSKSLTAVIDKINEVYAYYDQEDYKDDGFKKGKQEHARLIELFRNFEASDKKFGAALDDMEDKVSQARLDELSGDPSKNFEYTVVDFNMKAKKIAGYVQHNKYQDMSADDLQKLTDDLEPALNAMKDAGKSKTMASTYFSAADDLLKSSKELMRRIREHRPFDSIEKEELGTSAGWMVDGSPDKVIYSYNQLIQRRSMLSIGG
jgi:hypothetical protein